MLATTDFFGNWVVPLFPCSAMTMPPSADTTPQRTPSGAASLAGSYAGTPGTALFHDDPTVPADVRVTGQAAIVPADPHGGVLAPGQTMSSQRSGTKLLG